LRVILATPTPGEPVLLNRVGEATIVNDDTGVSIGDVAVTEATPARSWRRSRSRARVPTPATRR